MPPHEGPQPVATTPDPPDSLLGPTRPRLELDLVEDTFEVGQRVLHEGQAEVRETPPHPHDPRPPDGRDRNWSMGCVEGLRLRGRDLQRTCRRPRESGGQILPQPKETALSAGSADSTIPFAGLCRLDEREHPQPEWVPHGGTTRLDLRQPRRRDARGRTPPGRSHHGRAVDARANLQPPGRSPASDPGGPAESRRTDSRAAGCPPSLLPIRQIPGRYGGPRPRPATATRLDAATEAEALREAIGRFASTTGPFPAHPVLGPLTKEEWTRFHCLHCAHHLGFARPLDEAPAVPVAED